MLKNKLYTCEIPDCGRSVQIRSTIKSGEHKGKKSCSICKQKIEGKKKVAKPIKKFTQKNIEKRKEERSGLPRYYEEGIKLLQLNPYCQNCGIKMKVWLHPINRIAHLISKSHYKSVMANSLNRVFLCDSTDNENGRSCHVDFDNKINERPLMPVFELAMIKYRLFKDDVLEQGKEREIFENYL